METQEQKLLSKYNQAKTDTYDQMFKAWCGAKTLDDREDIHAEYRALTKLTFHITRSINGGSNV